MIIGESLTFCFRSELISSLPLPMSGLLSWFLAFWKFMVPKYWKRLDQGNRFWHNMTCPYLQIIFMVLLWPIRSHFRLNQIIKVWKIGWSNGRQSGTAGHLASTETCLSNIVLFGNGLWFRLLSASPLTSKPSTPGSCLCYFQTIKYHFQLKTPKSA